MPATQRIPFLALLRGINVGGRHSVPMAELRRCFEQELHCTTVATYIQSGNLVGRMGADRLREGAVAAALTARFGFEIPVALRTQAELDGVIAANPFLAGAAPTEHLHCVFLRSAPPPALLAALRAKAVDQEQIAVGARELYLDLPHGAGRSKLALAVVAPGMPENPTMRNWKTVLAMAAMLGAV